MILFILNKYLIGPQNGFKGNHIQNQNSKSKSKLKLKSHSKFKIKIKIKINECKLIIVIFKIIILINCNDRSPNCLKPVYLIIKLWSRAQGINEPFYGTLPSVYFHYF